MFRRDEYSGASAGEPKCRRNEKLKPPGHQTRQKEEDVKKILAAVALIAMVALVGCQDTKKVTELQGQLDQSTQKLTEMEGQVTQLTAEKDSLMQVIINLTAKTPVKPVVKQPTTPVNPPGKPPRTGR